MVKVKGLYGFTLIELVLVIAILGILAVVALPTLFNTTLTSARGNAAAMTAASVQEGLGIYVGDQVAQGKPKSYPAALDAVADGTLASPANVLFKTILEEGVTSSWIKKAGTCYVYDKDGSGTVGTTAQDDFYAYDSAAGSFLFIAAGC